MPTLPKVSTHLSTILLFLTILAGALVHATGSGLACPDWPLCVGKFFPEMTGAVLFEHSHRLIAGTTGVVVWLTGGLYFYSSVRKLKKLVVVAVMVSVLLQAILGGLTVLYQLPGWISTSHFLMAHLTFGGMLFLSFLALTDRETVNESTLFDRLLGPVTIVVLLFQMVLGAWLRHIGSKGPPLAPVCEDFPWCEPSWISAMTQYYLSIYWFHRFFSIMVITSVVTLTVWVLYKYGIESLDSQLGIVASLLTFMQIILGILSVRSNLSVLVVMLHTGGAAVLFSVILWINFRFYDTRYGLVNE